MDTMASNIRRVVHGLETLKNEHTTILTQLLANREGVRKCSQESGESGSDRSDDFSTIVIDEKIAILKKSLESIDIGLDEATVLIQLAGHTNTIEAEKAKLTAQVRRLLQESAWLRDELTSTQQKLENSEQRNVQLEEEIKQLKFMQSLKQYDNDSMSDKNTLTPTTPTNNNHENTMLHNNSLNASSASLGSVANQSFDHGGQGGGQGYEIPARLRTLHNLGVWGVFFCFFTHFISNSKNH